MAGKGTEIDLLELARIILRGKLIIAICCLMAALAGGYYAFQVAEPRFSATARLALQVRGQQVVDLESVMSGVSTDTAAINTELEIIASRSLIERLVKELDLTTDPEFNVELRDEKKLSFTEVKNFIKGLFGLLEPEAAAPDTETVFRRVTSKVSRSVSVSVQPKTYLFDILITTGDPEKSAALANKLAEIYIDYQIQTKFEAVEYAVSWLSERVAELEKELKLSEDEVKKLRNESGLVSLEALEALNVRAKDTRDRLDDTNRAAEELLFFLEQIRAARSREDLEAISTTLNDADLNRLLANTSGATQLSGDAFQGQVQALVTRKESEYTRLSSQQQILQKSYEQILEQVDQQTTQFVALTQMIREVDATKVLYETFLTRLKETSIQIGLQQADSRILSPAIRGTQVAPRKTRFIALSIILGGLLGVSIVLLQHYRKDGIKTARELEVLSNNVVLGQIPRIPIKRRKDLIKYLVSKPTSAAAEAVRNLRTSILLSDVDNPPKVIMSTSSIPGEGKTTQAIALALNLSRMDKSVLLIEGDIRRRTLDEYFQLGFKGGIASVISGDTLFEDAVLTEPDCGFDILMGEKTSVNAADLFSSAGFEEFIDMVRARYDFIVIDTPPVLVVPDARVIAQLSDAIIYTVRWDHTQKSQIQDGIQHFSSVGQKITGLVLSQVDRHGMKRYGYGSYTNYGHGYYDD